MPYKTHFGSDSTSYLETVSHFNMRYNDEVIVSHVQTVDNSESINFTTTHWRIVVGNESHYANTIDDVLDLIENYYHISPDDESLLNFGERLRTEKKRIFDELLSELQ